MDGPNGFSIGNLLCTIKIQVKIKRNIFIVKTVR